MCLTDVGSKLILRHDVLSDSPLSDVLLADSDSSSELHHLRVDLLLLLLQQLLLHHRVDLTAHLTHLIHLIHVQLIDVTLHAHQLLLLKELLLSQTALRHAADTETALNAGDATDRKLRHGNKQASKQQQQTQSQ